MKNYILVNNEPVAVSMMEMATWMQTADRVLQRTELPYKSDEEKITVSTVFLGLDHSWGSGPPVLWETMIFGGPCNNFQNRYTSRDDALAGHERAIRYAMGEMTEEEAMGG